MKFLKIVIPLIIISLIIITIYLYFYKNKSIELTQFSASDESIQMMGYKIKTKTGKVILIDGGTQKETQNVINKIKEDGEKVDYWFITHPHNDHAGAFLEIVKNTHIPIDNIYISLNDFEWYEKNEPNRIEFTKEIFEIVNNSRIKEKVIQPKINDKIKIDSLIVEILGIKNPEITENAGNEQSMVITFDTGKNKILFLGDTGIKSSEKLLKNQKEKLDSDIVQMAHHGQNGATKKLYEVVKPNICLWPTQKWLWNNETEKNITQTSWSIEETKSWMQELGVKENYIETEEITLKIK